MKITKCFIHRTVGDSVNDVIYFEGSGQYFSSKLAFLKKSGNIKENNLPNDTRIKQVEWDALFGNYLPDEKRHLYDSSLS